MTKENEGPERPKDKELEELLAMTQQEKPTQEEAEGEKLKEKENPDAEDPRLYSPLQEPDVPSPKERISEESPAEEEKEASQDEE